MSSSRAPEPIDPNFRIELPLFEGPLDLLLHLISKHELDILDLPVAFVTEKYLQYIDLMEELNLDVASEYLVMAAKLTHIKSKMLLPQPPAEQDEEDEERDPREDLIKRLLEYQKYRTVADQLGEQALLGRDVFFRGTEPPKHDGPAPLARHDVFRLLDAFNRVLSRHEDRKSFEVTAERISIQDRIGQIADLLMERRGASFEELFEQARVRYDVVVTFLAILEMAKMNMLHVAQKAWDAPMFLEYRVLDSNLASYPPETQVEVPN